MYLIVITRKRNVGSLMGHAVWKAVDFDIISYKKTMLHLSEIQVSWKTFSNYACLYKITRWKQKHLCNYCSVRWLTPPNPVHFCLL